MENIQKFIPICDRNNEDSNEYVDPSIIKDVITKKFMTGDNMKSILCYINSKFENGKNIDIYYIYQFDKEKFKNIFSDIKELSNYERGGYGIILTAKMFNTVDVIIKITSPDSRKANGGIEFELREFNIGMNFLNKLRDKIPTFVYTFAGIIGENINKDETFIDTDEETILIVYEKIEGKAFIDELSNMSFERFLLLFLQILISLEVAQREFKFVHYDFHTGNILVKKLESPHEYSVLLDTYEYKFIVDEIPVIIDFGLAHVEDKNGTTIDPIQQDFEGVYNIYNPIIDIYNFLYYCYEQIYIINEDNYFTVKDPVTNLTKRELLESQGLTDEELNAKIEKDILEIPFIVHIQNLTRFLTGVNRTAFNEPGGDPFYEQFDTASRKIICFDKNPLSSIHSIYKNYDFIKNSKNFFILPRKDYQIINFDINTHKLFYKEKNYERFTAFKRCVKNINSFIYYTYCVDTIRNYKEEIEEYRLSDDQLYEFVGNDFTMLEKFFEIKVPEKNRLENAYKIINNIFTLDYSLKLNTSDEFFNIFQYEDKIRPYLNIYYIIKQYRIGIFGQWQTKFEESNLYIFYKRYRRQNETYKKFIKALKDYIKDPFFNKYYIKTIETYKKYIDHYGIFNM